MAAAGGRLPCCITGECKRPGRLLAARVHKCARIFAISAGASALSTRKIYVREQFRSILSTPELIPLPIVQPIDVPYAAPTAAFYLTAHCLTTGVY
jgi:hypothetical protein